MDSVKTNNKKYTKLESGHCIASLKAIPERYGFVLMIAWEWEEAAKKGFFAFTRSSKIVSVITERDMRGVMDFGVELTSSERLLHFGDLFAGI
jgi:hypothetical protein